MQIEIHSEDERGNIVRLLKPVKFRFREKTFVVHAGFECDGVSVPRPAWPLVSPQIDPRSLRAGIAHDYIYRVQPEGWTRARRGWRSAPSRAFHTRPSRRRRRRTGCCSTAP